MTVSIRSPDQITARQLADFAAPLQGKPNNFVIYLVEDSDTITAEIDAVNQWQAHTAIAVDRDAVVGFLLGEVDPEMGRVWGAS